MSVTQVSYKNVDSKSRNMIMFGLCFAMLCASFDGTIIGTCGMVVVEELGGLSLYSWMVTAYMLCECIMIPLAGKLSDLYGRKPLFLIGLVIFTIGSLVAQELTSKNYDLIFNLFNVKEDNRLREVDFLLSRKGAVVPVEVKSAYSKRHSSLDRFMLVHRDLVDRAIVIHT